MPEIAAVVVSEGSLAAERAKLGSHQVTGRNTDIRSPHEHERETTTRAVDIIYSSILISPSVATPWLSTPLHGVLSHACKEADLGSQLRFES